MIGQTVRNLRKRKKISQTELAKILHVSQQTVTAWETGKAEPSSSAVSNLADYFNVTTDYLLGRPEKKDDDTKFNDIDDLDKMIDNARSFGGKQMTENDREIIKAYLQGFYDNKNQGK